MTKRGIALVLLAVAGLAFLAACGDDDTPAASTPSPAAPSPSAPAATPTKGRPAELKDVKLGYSPLLINAPFYLGIEKGYFADEGINLKLERIGPGADVLTQTAAGNFDAGSAGIGAGGFNAAAASIKDKREVPFEVVSPLHVERPPVNTPLVVSKARFDAGEITKVSDLKGKKLAVNNRGSATEYWLNLALKSGGVSIKDVTVQTLGFNDMAAALQNKGIDGAMLGEPLTTQAKDLGLVQVLTDSFAKGEAATAVYWNRDWARKNPELAAGFLRAFLKSAAELESGAWDTPAVVEILQKYTNVPADVIRRASRPHFDHQGKFDVASFRDLEAYFRSQNQLTYEGDVDFNAFMRLK